MPPRFFVDRPLRAGHLIDLPDGVARHVQVLRLQPGDPLTLFDGHGGEWAATVAQMRRNQVSVELGAFDDANRELPLRVTLALGMPANDRMDAVVEKATELGAAEIQPLLCERSVLRLNGERALKKVAHWQSVAVAACEQSGRTRVPRIAPVRALGEWLAEPRAGDPALWMLAVRDAQPWPETPLPAAGAVCLSGPEGGLSAVEETAARAAGFAAVSLGPRVLRADTAPLAAIAHLALSRAAAGACA